MNEREDNESRPLKSVHDFLTELDNEWSRFRRAAIIGVILLAVLIFFLIIRSVGLIVRIRRLGGLVEALDEISLIIIVIAFVAYEISLLIRQYRFFNKWERRMALLLDLEQRMMKKIDESEEKRT